jgi:lipopolysaccharide/colanic/teichoic acid biosynthesis glycosyltransferase
MRNKAYLKYQSIFRGKSRTEEVVQELVSNMPTATITSDVVETEYQPRFELPQTVESVQAEAVSRSGRLYLKIRQVIDCGVALMAMLAFWILFPFIALAIKIDSPGPVFFRQERIGANRRRPRRAGFTGEDERKILRPGRPFQIFKLRTMHVDAEAKGPQWASQNDPRVTRVGRYLRKTRLDEFPQFLNVLRGDMSVIGPRPERLCFIRQFEKSVPHYRDRLLVRPGITGLAQVRNGYDKDTESVIKKVELDREYIISPNVVADLKIMLSTVRVVVTGAGAN